MLLQSSILDTCESEKREVLEGALECLESLPHARVGAALRLLEHLASGERGELARELFD